MDDHGTEKLKAGSWGITGLIALGALMMSPALGIFGNFGPIAISAGNLTPVIFLLSLLVTLPTAICYAMVSKEVPSSGSAYTWLWETINPFIGIFLGWIMLGFFLIVVFLQPLLLGLFFNELLSLLGIKTGFQYLIISLLLSSLLVSVFAYRGGNVGEKASVTDLIIQMVIVLALAITILLPGSSGKQVQISQAASSLSGLSQAMIFGVLSFTGFNVIANMAEETNNPRKTIPLAIVLSCVITGVYWILVSWAYMKAVPVDQILSAVKEDKMPVVLIAKKFWGGGEVIVIVTGLIASIGVYLATVIGASRVMYAMSRDGIIFKAFGKLNSRFKTPWNALNLVFILTFIFVLVPAAFLGIYFTYMWWARATVFFALVTYIFVSIANPLFYYRHRRKKFSFFWNGVVGSVSLIINIYLLYRAFFVDCWRSDWASGKSVVIFAMLWIIAGIIYVFIINRKIPLLYEKKAIYLDQNDN